MMSVSPALIGIVYNTQSSDVAVCLEAFAKQAAKRGFRVRGLLEERSGASGRHRCEMALRLIGSEDRVKISQERGRGAKGCRLDLGELMRAAGLLSRNLADESCDLLLINKFGKSECEGKGLRDLIAAAVQKGIPVITAVPQANLDAWRAFAGDMAYEIELDDLNHVADPFTFLLSAASIPAAA